MFYIQYDIRWQNSVVLADNELLRMRSSLRVLLPFLAGNLFEEIITPSLLYSLKYSPISRYQYEMRDHVSRLMYAKGRSIKDLSLLIK
jgi:hypothetical protein